jgi:hypothetical protein
MWREEHIEFAEKPAVPLESVKRGSGAEQGEADPDDDVQVS